MHQQKYCDLQYLVLLGFVFGLMGAIISLIGRSAITGNGDPHGVSIQQHQVSSQATQACKYGQVQDAFIETLPDSIEVTEQIFQPVSSFNILS